MKKVIMFATVVACAMFAQAASFDWTSNTSYLVDKEGQKLTSYAQGGQIVLALLHADTTTFSDAEMLQPGTLYTSGKSASKVGGTYKFTYGDPGALKNGDVLAVLYYKDGDFSQLLNAAGTDPMYTTYTVAGLGDNSWSGPVYNFATGNFQEPVPEPTSGLLLLVGASLLALRRKQK